MTFKTQALALTIITTLLLPSCLSVPRPASEKPASGRTVIKIEGEEGYIPCRIFNDTLYADSLDMQRIFGAGNAEKGAAAFNFNISGSDFLIEAREPDFYIDSKPRKLRHPALYEDGKLWLPVSFYEDYFSLKLLASSPLPLYRRLRADPDGAFLREAGAGRMVLSLKFIELPRIDYVYCGNFAKLFLWAPPGPGFLSWADTEGRFSVLADTGSYPPSLTLNVTGHDISNLSFFPEHKEVLAALQENLPNKDTGAVAYRSISMTENGVKNTAHLVYADLNCPSLEIVPLISGNSIKGRETTSSMSGNVLAEAAVNGSFYLADGDPLGTLVIRGRLLSENIYDRSSLVIYRSGRVSIEKLNARLYLDADGQVIKVGGINRKPGKGELVLFTPEYSSAIETQKSFSYFRLNGDNLEAIERAPRIEIGSSLIICCGNSGRTLKALAHSGGKKAYIYVQYDGKKTGVLHAIGGGPMIVRDGQSLVSGGLENFRDDIIFDRHPRTAAAITYDNKLILAVVDGRSRESQGMTLKELARFLTELGARDAINFDGGGSSTMVFQNMVVNEPSDGSERPVSTSIAIIKNPLK